MSLETDISPKLPKINAALTFLFHPYEAPEAEDPPQLTKLLTYRAVSQKQVCVFKLLDFL